jgi:amidase
MQRITRERIGYLLDRRIPPVAVVRDGETVLVETEDARTGRARLPEHTTTEWLYGLHQPGPYYSNPVTGPLLVEGAEPGDTLAVTIEEIVCDTQGFTGFWPESAHFPEWFPEPQTRIFPIEHGEVVFNEQIRFPTRPMVGTIGTAPHLEALSTHGSGRYGGNMDCPDVKPGATLFLPVNVPGALLFLGDCHAAQGDGEFCGGAIEQRADVTLTVRLQKGRPRSMRWPRLILDDALVTIGCDKPLESAMKHALGDMILWLEEEYGLTRAEAYMLLTHVGDARACQVSVAPYTMRVRMPRAYLPPRGDRG